MQPVVLFLKANVAGYVRRNGVFVKPHQDKRPSGGKWFGDSRHVHEILAAIRNSPHVHHGLRVMSVYDAVPPAVAPGDTLQPSSRWNDGSPTKRRLKGTSTLGVRGPKSVARAVDLAGMYYGKQVVLVGSHERRPGADEGEADRKSVV